MANPGSLFSKFPSSFLVLTRSYATKSYYPHKNARAALEQTTQGTYSGNHPVTTDVDKVDASDNVPFYHQPAKVTGPATNPSKVLSKEVNVSGDPIPQNAVYTEPALGTVRFPITALYKEIPGSENFYKRADVQANDKLNRNITQEDNT